MIIEEDSFEDYKKYLEDFIHDAEENVIKPPKKPFNAYMHYLLDKSSSERLKNPGADWSELTQRLALEWGTLKESEKSYYQQAYQRRLKGRERVLKEYSKVSTTYKLLTPYTRFYKRVYPNYKKLSPEQAAKVISKEWKLLDESKKKEYIKQYENEKTLQQNRVITNDDKEAYKELNRKYEKQLNDEKDKVSRKSEITKNIANFKLLNKAKAKVKRELERAARKNNNKTKVQDSDSQNVEDLLRKVKEVKNRKAGKVATPAQQQSSSSQESQQPVVAKSKRSPSKSKSSKKISKQVKTPKQKSPVRKPKVNKPIPKSKTTPAPVKQQSRPRLRTLIATSPVDAAHSTPVAGVKVEAKPSKTKSPKTKPTKAKTTSTISKSNKKTPKNVSKNTKVNKQQTVKRGRNVTAKTVKNAPKTKKITKKTATSAKTTSKKSRK